MNTQQMLQSVRKLQREYEKEHKVLEEKVFEGTASGVVKVYLKGNLTIEKVEFLDDSILSSDNKEMIEETIAIAYQNAKDLIDAEEDKLMAKYQQQPGGVFF